MQSNIPLPRAGTLTDAVQTLGNQSQLRLRKKNAARSTNEDKVTFPADKAMWDALLSAVKSDPSSQIPPLYVLNDGDSGEALYANQRFVQEFLERWEEGKLLKSRDKLNRRNLLKASLATAAASVLCRTDVEPNQIIHAKFVCLLALGA